MYVIIPRNYRGSSREEEIYIAVLNRQTLGQADTDEDENCERPPPSSKEIVEALCS